MTSYPVRPLELTPLAAHGPETVIGWLLECELADEVIAPILGVEWEATFTPMGVAWLAKAQGDGTPIMIAGIEKGMGVLALRSDLLDGERMRQVHAFFGAAFHSAPPHPLRSISGWDAFWQVVALDDVAHGNRIPWSGTEEEFKEFADAVLDPEWAVAVGLAEDAEGATSLRSRLENALNSLSLRTHARSQNACEDATQVEAIRAAACSLLTTSMQRPLLHLHLELLAGALRAKVVTANAVLSLPSIKDTRIAQGVLDLLEGFAKMGSSETCEGEIPQDGVGPGTGRWVVRVLDVGSERCLRLTPLDSDDGPRGGGVREPLHPRPIELGGAAAKPLPDPVKET